MTEYYTAEQLRGQKCKPCEGGIEAVTPQDAASQIMHLPGWELDGESKAISKKWNCKNFVKSLEFCNQIGQVAEQEQHHPDLHLTGYRHVLVVLTTHAIGGLSENDFIVASKIDQLKS